MVEREMLQFPPNFFRIFEKILNAFLLRNTTNNKLNKPEVFLNSIVYLYVYKMALNYVYNLVFSVVVCTCRPHFYIAHKATVGEEQ